MSKRLIALELYERQRQERLAAALASWQPYFAERAQERRQADSEKIAVDCTTK